MCNRLLYDKSAYSSLVSFWRRQDGGIQCRSLVLSLEQTVDAHDEDRYYVILADGVDVVDFQESLPFLSSLRFHLELELIGGQNKALFVTCKKSFFLQRSVKKMVLSYVPVPTVARIPMALIHALMDKLESNDMLNITLKYYPDQDRSNMVSSASFSAFLESSNEKLCTSCHFF